MGRLLILYVNMCVVFGLAACAPQLEPEESCNFVQNSLQRRVSWASTPLVVGVEDSFPAQYYPAILDAMKVWEEALGGKQLFAPQLKVIRRSEVNSVHISLLWENEWTNVSGSTSNYYSVEQAKTSISFQSDNIYRAVIFYNAAQNRFSVAEEPKAGVPGHTDMESLTIHELGHALGLDHSPNPASVMYPSLKTNTVRNEVSALDVNSMQCEY